LGAARLFHFSEDPSIARFEPRPVRVPAERGPGREWLNGPLVWAIDDAHQPLYFFPRECPRILLWRTPATTEEDLASWWRGGEHRMLAHVEAAWLERLRNTTLYRYGFDPDPFESIEDVGMWVARSAVTPTSVEAITDLPAALAAADVELIVLPNLLPLKGVWDSTLFASGTRLRNAAGWTS
jgi:hypothetical protein